MSELILKQNLVLRRHLLLSFSQIQRNLMLFNLLILLRQRVYRLNIYKVLIFLIGFDLIFQIKFKIIIWRWVPRMCFPVCKRLKPILLLIGLYDSLRGLLPFSGQNWSVDKVFHVFYTFALSIFHNFIDGFWSHSVDYKCTFSSSLRKCFWFSILWHNVFHLLKLFDLSWLILRFKGLIWFQTWWI
jgi:hypothetical protein